MQVVVELHAALCVGIQICEKIHLADPQLMLVESQVEAAQVHYTLDH